MGRIRTVKPDFFRHEALQDLERSHPHLRPMLVFEGLWTCSDKCGRFPWRPRHLKLDILPFLDFSMEDAMDLLEQAGFLRRYTSGGKEYGWVPTWKQHQRITGKEATDPPRYPDPLAEGSTEESPDVSQGNINGTKKDGTPREKPGRKPASKEKPVADAVAAFKLPHTLEAWFDAIWWDLYPETVIRDGNEVKVERGPRNKARERFADWCRKVKPVAIYVAFRAYIKNHPKVKDGYVQTFNVFLGPGKATVKDYLETTLPYLEKYPALAALTAPPESEESFQALLKQDEKAPTEAAHA